MLGFLLNICSHWGYRICSKKTIWFMPGGEFPSSELLNNDLDLDFMLQHSLLLHMLLSNLSFAHMTGRCQRAEISCVLHQITSCQVVFEYMRSQDELSNCLSNWQRSKTQQLASCPAKGLPLRGKCHRGRVVLMRKHACFSSGGVS